MLDKEIISEITHNKKRENKEVVKQAETSDENNSDTLTKQFKVEQVNTNKHKVKKVSKNENTKKIKKV